LLCRTEFRLTIAVVVRSSSLSPLILANKRHTALLSAVLPEPHVRVDSWAEVVAESSRRRCVVFVDSELLGTTADAVTNNLEIVAISSASRVDAIATLIERPWLSHLLTTEILSSPCARLHITTLLGQIDHGLEPDVLGPSGIGRAALLASSARRDARFERMRDFFAAQGVSERGITNVIDIAEELVTNALYDAPAEARFFDAPIPRTQEVNLPPEHACEIRYGIEDQCLFVRVRDPFGAFTRSRLVEVLSRCGTQGMTLDESRGGAGLGLWRVLSKGMAVVVSVIPGRVTDFFVRIAMTKTHNQPFAIHLYFPDRERDGSLGRFAADHDDDLMDESFTAVSVA
jgi:hypothetical protein